MYIQLESCVVQKDLVVLQETHCVLWQPKCKEEKTSLYEHDFKTHELFLIKKNIFIIILVNINMEVGARVINILYIGFATTHLLVFMWERFSKLHLKVHLTTS